MNSEYQTPPPQSRPSYKRGATMSDPSKFSFDISIVNTLVEQKTGKKSLI